MLDEQTIKRLLLKAAKSGNVEHFKNTIEKIESNKAQAKCNLISARNVYL